MMFCVLYFRFSVWQKKRSSNVILTFQKVQKQSKTEVKLHLYLFLNIFIYVMCATSKRASK